MSLQKTDSDPTFTGIVMVVTIVFVIQKLFKAITWSWLWVLSPLWITGLLGLFVLLIMGVDFWVRKNGVK